MWRYRAPAPAPPAAAGNSVVGADGDVDAIRYYQAGADITLPGDSSLLIAAALGARARRAGGRHRPRLLRVGWLSVDPDARTARVDEQPLAVSPARRSQASS